MTPWAALTAVAAGVLRRQLAAPTAGNERVFACIIAGTTLAGEPAWTVTKGAKTAEAAGPTWQEVTGQPGVNGNTTNSPTWLQNKNLVVTIGLIIYDSVSAALQIVSTAGTTGNGAQPTFSATAGATTADNTATWTSLGLASGFAGWAAPFARAQSAVAANWMAAGDTLFIGDDHAETQAAATTVTLPGGAATPNNLYSIDHTASVVQASATLLAGAKIITTGNSALNVQGSFYCYGVIFQCGTGANAPVLSAGTGNASYQVYDTCSMQCLATSLGATSLTLGSTSAVNVVLLINTTMQFGSTGGGIRWGGTQTVWKNTASAILGTPPTALISSPSNAALFEIDGVDLSAITGSIVAAFSGGGRIVLRNCKLNSGVVIGATPQNPAGTIDAVTLDSAATNYQIFRARYTGTQTVETVIVRTGGASSGTSISYKLTTTANSFWTVPFPAVIIAQWNTVTSTNRVVTLSGIWSAAAVPNNDDIWIEAEYFGSASTPQASFSNNTKANNLATGTGLTADSTSAWDSLVTARANTTAYSLGDVRKVATNSGRIFFCTTAGTSAGSEPAGYASAVDGGSVTDNTAVFRAGVRFTLAVTLSSPQPAMAGPIYVTVNAAKVSSTFYVDPLIVLS